MWGRSLLREKRDVAYSQGLSGSQIDGRGRIVLRSQEGMCVLEFMEIVGVGVGEVGEKEGWV